MSQPPAAKSGTKHSEESGILRKGKWLKSEEVTLKENAREFLEQMCLTLDEAMALPRKERRKFFEHCGKNIGRPTESISKKCKRMFDAQNNMGTYTAAECQALKKLHSKMNDDDPTKWRDLGKKLGRSAASVRDRVTKVGTKVSTKKRRKWTKKEKAALELARKKHGDNWKLIGAAVGTRTPRQCLKYSLDGKTRTNIPKLSIGDQVRLVELLAREHVHFVDDIDWTTISHKMSLSKDSPITPDILRTRFKRMIVYRVPFYSQLNFNDTIDLLMTHFVKPFREDKISEGKSNTAKTLEEADDEMGGHDSDEVPMEIPLGISEDEVSPTATVIDVEQHKQSVKMEDCVF